MPNLSGWKRNHVLNGGYSSYLDGKFHTYQGLDKCLDEIREQMIETLDSYERIAAENEHLKDEHWKDEQMAKMREETERMKDDYYRGFPISKAESEAISAWKDQHWTVQHQAPTNEARLRKMGAIGGSYSYHFVPTSIGTAGSCRCNACYNKALRQAYKELEEARAADSRFDFHGRMRQLCEEYDAEFDFQSL